MAAWRWALVAVLCVIGSCARSTSEADPRENIDARAPRKPTPDSACELIVGKMRTCRDAILMTARTGMVATGATPEEAVELSVEISEGFERNTTEICALYPESDMVRGTRCFAVNPCDAFAACIVEGVEPAARATGPRAPTCPSGSTAVQSERRGEISRWCVRTDGLPNGAYIVTEGEQVRVEGNYTMGVPHGTWTYHRDGGAPHTRVFSEGVVVEMDGQRVK